MDFFYKIDRKTFTISLKSKFKESFMEFYVQKFVFI